MIATHTPKMLNARIKSSALAVEIKGEVPPGCVCSKTVNMRRKFWAAPKNSADIKYWREEVLKLNNSYNFVESLPHLDDPFVKQLLMPNENWQDDLYTVISPVSSMGVTHELYQRLREKRLPNYDWIVQPTLAARANHGGMILVQKGSLRMLRRGVAKIDLGGWKGTFVQLKARCEGVNISSGMMAVGLPSLTAVGGFVHSIERYFGQEIEFAVGVQSSDWRSGAKRTTLNKTTAGSSVGRVKGKNVKAVPSFSAEEVVANVDLVILFKTEGSMEDLRQTIIANAYRIAGGSVFDLDVSIINNDRPAQASFLIDASRDVIRLGNKDGLDTLDAALQMYGDNGEWRLDGSWWQPRNGYTLNHSGYAFLEQPKKRKNTRNDYLHAWAEPVFTCITQGAMSESCWWKRDVTESGVFWTGS